ncbi:ORF6N domain-containing protein [Aureibacillus halotolerans]|uniref:ORF6N domain-containing protein n=1 Tax=Aureibacillus halotolerans TaxID=1508390 RepID=A0A4R6TM85_9BACI|nr:ORF6N domain-containing protein [Aureibacillus halotolerans]TDQ31898.1 ORF6N domain-containing protein [Aureibacillus halotolerans]
MNNVVQLNVQEQSRPPVIKEYNGERVVTFKDIDQLHERSAGTAARNFSQHRERFVPGEDFHVITYDEARFTNFVERPNSQGLTLVTESGYLMLVKSFTDDLAWEVQRQLVKVYFSSTQEVPMSDYEKLMLTMKTAVHHGEKIEDLTQKYTKIEHTVDNLLTSEHCKRR